MERLPFLSEKLDTCGTRSDVAVCTLWTEKDNVKLGKELYHIKGNLYSKAGIGYMLRNLLACPGIRYLIVCGEDRTGSGQALLDIFAGTGSPDGTLMEHSERLRTGVEAIDMRGREDELNATIKGLERKGPWGAPIMLKGPDAATGMGTGMKGFRVEGNSVSATWLKAMDIVTKFGWGKSTEHGMGQKEILNLMAVIRGDESDIPAFMPFGKEELDAYRKAFFSPEKGGVSYTYGERLFRYALPKAGDKWEGEMRRTFDQIGNATEHLKKIPHTRRAVAFTWSVEKDSISESPPCMTQVSWNVTDGRLHQTVVFRSHDIFGGWPLNAYALRELQKSMAKETGNDTGDMIIISNSAHIYENNLEEASRIISGNYTGRKDGFTEDELGYFVITLEGGVIKAAHSTKEGEPTGMDFTGKEAKGIYDAILHENLISRMEHAAYMGRELARAEAALRKGKRYRQV